jgi:2-amino-4-hydroxy-6-hydroxymethyldihydropteridine diphosphokinase
VTLAYVALGANLNDAEGTLRAACRELAGQDDVRVLKVSSFYRTAPIGLKGQPDFINAVLSLDTDLSSRELLAKLFSIEQHFGRKRSVPNAPRTLDLDLLLFGIETSSDAQLTLPHPRMGERAFVLAPLHEIAPDLRIPGRGEVAELLAHCAGQRIVKL